MSERINPLEVEPLKIEEEDISLSEEEAEFLADLTEEEFGKMRYVVDATEAAWEFGEPMGLAAGIASISVIYFKLGQRFASQKEG